MGFYQFPQSITEPALPDRVGTFQWCVGGHKNEEVSFNGRTGVFGALYRGSNPRTSAILNLLVRVRVPP